MSGASGVGVMLGGGAEIHAPGRVWKVSAPDQRAKRRLESLVKKVVIDEAREMKGVLGPEAYHELFESKTRQLRDYETWRPGWMAVVFDPGYAHLFLWSLLHPAHPDATEEDVRAIFADAPEEVAAAYAQILPDFFTMLLAPVRSRIPPELLAKFEGAVAEAVSRLRRTPTSST